MSDLKASEFIDPSPHGSNVTQIGFMQNTIMRLQELIKREEDTQIALDHLYSEVTGLEPSPEVLTAKSGPGGNHKEVIGDRLKALKDQQSLTRNRVEAIVGYFKS